MTAPRQLRWGWTRSLSVATRLRSMGLAEWTETRYRADRNSPAVTRFVLTPTALGLDALQKGDPGRLPERATGLGCLPGRKAT